MPECEAIGEEKNKLQRKVGKHHLKAEPRIEVNHDGTGKNCLRRTTPRIEPDYRRPANALNEPLLECAPPITHVPAEPRPLDAQQGLAPFRGGPENCIEGEGKGFPITLPPLRRVYVALLFRHLRWQFSITAPPHQSPPGRSAWCRSSPC